MIRRSRFLLYTAVLAIALLSGGCALTPVVVDTALGLMPTPQVEEPTSVVTREPLPLEQTIWVLKSLNGDPYFPETEITIEFHLDNTAGRGSFFRGGSACGFYGCPIELSDERLVIEHNECSVSANECPSEEYSELDTLYSRILSGVERYALEDNTLTLTTETGEILIFTPQGEQTEWVLQSLNEVSALPEQKVTLTVSDARQILKGHGGCNFYGVPYERNNARIDIATDRFRHTIYECGVQEIMEQEQQYFEILTRVEYYEHEGDTLTLSTEDGDTLVFLPQPK